jgi:hypothetical protein
VTAKIVYNTVENRNRVRGLLRIYLDKISLSMTAEFFCSEAALRRLSTNFLLEMERVLSHEPDLPVATFIGSLCAWFACEKPIDACIRSGRPGHQDGDINERVAIELATLLLLDPKFETVQTGLIRAGGSLHRASTRLRASYFTFLFSNDKKNYSHLLDRLPRRTPQSAIFSAMIDYVLELATETHPIPDVRPPKSNAYTWDNRAL